MSFQEQFSSGGAKPMGQPTRSPACPKCSAPMSVRQITPVLFAPNFDDTVFGCAACGTEVKRTVKRT